MLSRLMPYELHNKSDPGARSADVRHSCIPFQISKDPTADNPRFELRPRFHVTPRTDHPHAVLRQVAPASRSDQRERYGLVLARTAAVRLWRQTAVVDTDAQHFQSLPSRAAYVSSL